MTVAWPGDPKAFGRAVSFLGVLRGPPEVQISSPGEGATVVADTDLALAGAAGDTTDGKLGGGALAWTVDGAAAGLGGSGLTTRIHALGHHVVTLRATNAAGIAGSRSGGHRGRAPVHHAGDRDHCAEGRRRSPEGPRELHGASEQRIRRPPRGRVDQVARPLHARRRGARRTSRSAPESASAPRSTPTRAARRTRSRRPRRTAAASRVRRPSRPPPQLSSRSIKQARRRVRRPPRPSTRPRRTSAPRLVLDTVRLREVLGAKEVTEARLGGMMSGAWLHARTVPRHDAPVVRGLCRFSDGGVSSARCDIRLRRRST